MPCIRLVYDIIMHERCRVEEFEGDGCAVGALGNRSAFSRYEQDEKGAHHLALSRTHIRQCPTQVVILVGQCFFKKFAIAVQFNGHRLAYLVEKIHGNIYYSQQNYKIFPQIGRKLVNLAR